MLSSIEEKTSYISFYRENGFNLVPLKLNGNTHFEWGPYQAKKSTDAEIEAWKKQTDSFGIVTGSISNLLVIDVDAEDLFEGMHLGQLAAQTYTEKRGDRYHIFLRTKTPIASESLKFDGKTDIDILSEAHLVYCGGMPHPKSGEQYRHLDWSPKTIKETKPESIEALKRFWREHRGLVTKTEKGLSKPPKGVTITGSLLDIINDCVVLEEETKTSEGIVCRCPFPSHKDTDPSFFVNTEKNVFFCHGCAKGGGAIEFISTLYGMGKKEAIAWLEQKGALTVAEKESDEEFNHDCFFEKDSTLYMEVGNPQDNEYRFGYMKDGVVELTETVGNIKPVEIPRAKNGKVTALMSIPSENIVSAELLDSKALFDEIYTHIARYCDMAPEHLELTTFYTLFTWFHRKVHDIGFLRFLGDFGKGKSRMLDVAGDLCMYPLRAGGAGSFSGMMRQYENWHGTLILDESDISGDTTDPRTKYHNAGQNDRGTFLLTDKHDPTKQEVFTPFGPRLFGARETFGDNALESRLLSMSMYSTNNEDIDVLLLSQYFKDAAILRDKIARFVLEHWDKIDGDVLVDFPGLGLSRRLRQLLMPLSILGQIWPEAIGKIKTFGVQRQKEVKLEASQSWAGSLFNMVLGLARGTTSLPLDFRNFKNEEGELAAITPAMLKAITGRSGQQATKTLKSIGFEIETKSITVYVYGDEGKLESKPQTVRAYAISTSRGWEENINSYYYTQNGDEDKQREVPEILKSQTFVESPKEPVITKITNITTLKTAQEIFFSEKRDTGQRGLEDVEKKIKDKTPGRLALDTEFQRQQDIEVMERMNAEMETRA